MAFLKGFLESKSAAGTSEDRQTMARVTGGTSLSGTRGGGFTAGSWHTDKAITQGYERALWVFRCVDSLSAAVARLPLVKMEGWDEDAKVIKDTNMHRVLNKRPNKYETARQFKYRLSAQQLLSTTGSFIEVVPSEAGEVAELHLQPMDTKVNKDQKEFVHSFTLRGSDNEDYDLYPFSMERLRKKERTILWVRGGRPHPSDIYRQMTPMMVAGLAVETDFLARIFNRNFMANDGRPGLLINVKGRLQREDAEELKRYFSGGASVAGATRVIEADDISVADMSGTPRDAQWLDTLRGSKEDIIAAFGLSETFLGMASGRTFDNADAENEVTWMTTVVNHCDAMGDAMDPLTGDIYDDTFFGFDLTGVDVLQRQKRRRDAEALATMQAGGITWNEYREKVGQPTWAQPLAARIIILPSGVAFGENEQDTAGITQLQSVGMPPAEGLEQTARRGALEGAHEGQRRFFNDLSARALRVAGKALPHATGEVKQIGGGHPTIKGEVVKEEDEPHRVGETKTGRSRRKAASYEGTRTRCEAEIGATLSAWSRRQGKAVGSKIGGPRAVKHTRHWEGSDDGVGTKAINPTTVLDPDRWAEDAREDIASVLRPFVLKEARSLAREMSAFGLLDAISRPKGKPALNRLTGADDQNDVMDDILSPILDLVKRSAERQSVHIMDAITRLDAEGASLSEIKDEVQRQIDSRKSWFNGLAVQATTAAMENVQATLLGYANDLIERTWWDEDDDRVRPTHRRASGQTIKGSRQYFKVGEAFLRFPGDPTGPIHETAGCRCWTTWEPVAMARQNSA